jgi:hypothetical protein
LHADGANLFADTEPIEQRQVRWQERFADVEARMPGLLEQRDLVSQAAQQRGGGICR